MNVLIIADSPDCDIKREYQRGIDITICLDGAIAKIPEGTHIDYIIGDFDTIERNNIDTSILDAKHIKITEQDSTDLEKGIEYALSLGASSICIANAFGGRSDHSLYNISMLKKYSSKVETIYMTNGLEHIYYLCNTDLSLLGTIGGSVAIIPFPSACISSQGLKYDMQDFAIKIGENASVSNSLRKEKALISISGDALVICDQVIKLEKK
ncbi:MAG: thiamine diphosphokinase [Alphaproteobacteria bacterium]|jgi:thiamine pyrophosphokinase|nr:thiamine diphosphokinase [Candidatus Jidaibacter sp.]